MVRQAHLDSLSDGLVFIASMDQCLIDFAPRVLHQQVQPRPCGGAGHLIYSHSIWPAGDSWLRINPSVSWRLPHGQRGGRSLQMIVDRDDDHPSIWAAWLGYRLYNIRKFPGQAIIPEMAGRCRKPIFSLRPTCSFIKCFLYPGNLST